MKGFIMGLCAGGCWVCVIYAAVTWGIKAGAVVALAILLEAIIASVLIVETEQVWKKENDRLFEMLRNMEDDGK